MVRTEEIGGGAKRVVVIAPGSRLGDEECRRLLEAMEGAATDSAVREMRLELIRTTYADSQGIKLFVAAEKLGEERSVVVSCRVSTNLYNVLRMLNLDQTLDLRIEVEDHA